MLFTVGVITTFCYFIILGLVVYLNGLPFVETLNELGDFLAGAFSPIAFLWLVLGYRQQQKELIQNTEALLLQAKELKSSVEQATSMVGLTRDQLDLDLEKHRIEVEKYNHEISPILQLHCERNDNNRIYKGVMTAEFHLRNTGENCYNPEALFNGEVVSSIDENIISKERSLYFRLSLDMSKLPISNYFCVICYNRGKTVCAFDYYINVNGSGKISISETAQFPLKNSSEEEG